MDSADNKNWSASTLWRSVLSQYFYDNEPYFSAVCRFLSPHPKLLNYLINKEKQQLKSTPSQIKKSILGLSEGEQLLIHLALDLWDESGKVPIIDAYNHLGHSTVKRFLYSLSLIKGW